MACKTLLNCSLSSLVKGRVGPSNKSCIVMKLFHKHQDSFLLKHTFFLQAQCLQEQLVLGDNKQNSGLQVDSPIISGKERGLDDSITSEDMKFLKNYETGILEPCREDVSDISPFINPSFNLAAFANKSETIQQFVKMGVEIHKLDRIKGAPERLLKLNFEKDVKSHLRFLHDVGVTADQFGRFVTKNPFIFDQLLDDLQVRVNYLEAKKFSSEAITRIVSRNPKWLNNSTIEIDKRLGFFQRTFMLSGNEVRHLAALRPTLITYDLGKVSKSLFAVKEEMGFSEQEAKDLLLKKPKIYDIQTAALKSRFDYVHNIMGISHEQILQQASVLLFRNHITKERHEFLKALGKNQYNPKLPGFVSLETLVLGSDVDFCKNVAKTSIDVFNAFLKTC